MKLLIIGASGVIGNALSKEFAKEHEVLAAHRHSKTHPLDLSRETELESFFKANGPLDGVVVCAGHAPFGAFSSMPLETFRQGLESKFLGQVRVVKAAMHALSPNGAIVLTSGILGREPVIGSSSAAAANGALEAFVMSVAAENLGKFRINIVSPGTVADAEEKYKDILVGMPVTPMRILVDTYKRALTGPVTGRAFCI